MRHLRSILALPFMVAVVVPALILWWRGPPYVALEGPLAIVGTVALIGGLGLVVWTIGLFATEGRGTLAPWDPPEKLVVRGPYRHVRNPMIVGVAFVLCGEALVAQSLWIGIEVGIFVLANLLYIAFSEQKGLVQRFGEDYEAYVRNVPAWAPRVKPWDGTDDEAHGRGPNDLALVYVPPEQVRGIFLVHVVAAVALLALAYLILWSALGSGPSLLWVLFAGVCTWGALDLRDARIDALRLPPPKLVFGRLHADGKRLEVREEPGGKPVGGWRFVRRDGGGFVLMRPTLASRRLVKRYRPTERPFRMATLYEPQGKPDDDGWIRYPASAVWEDPPGDWRSAGKR